MKTSIIYATIIAAASILMLSCGNDVKQDDKSKMFIIKKIEYPVFIKNPYEIENAEWWKENIETSERIDFVKTLFDWAYSGKVKSYNYITNELLSTDEVKIIGNEPDTITVTESYPPYDEKDTVIQNKLDFNLIHKLKFLEEWSMNLKDYSVTKKVIGIAPTLTIYGDSIEIKGYKPLFWVYFDEEYIKTLDGPK